MCPHAEKLAFRSLRSASDRAIEELAKHPELPNRPYECECGMFHLTTKGLNGGPLTAEMVHQLAAALAA